MEKKMNRKRQLNETEQLKPLRKALLVTHVSGFVPQFEMNNVRILQELGYEVHYASNFHTPSYGTDNHRLDGTGIIRHQIDFVRSPFSAKNCLVYRQMCDLMKREHFSLVHCHTPMGGVMARLAAHVTGTGPVIYTAHGFHFFKGASWKNWLIYYQMEKFLSRYTDQQLCINQEDYELAKRKFHARYVDYVPGVGIDSSQFQALGDKERQMKRESLGVLPDQVVLLTSGEMIPRKNQEVLFRMLARMKDEPHRSAYEKLHLLFVRTWRIERASSWVGGQAWNCRSYIVFRIQGRYAGDLWSFGYLPFSILSGRTAAGDAGGDGQWASGDLFGDSGQYGSDGR